MVATPSPKVNRKRSYQASPIKRRRRTKAQMESLRASIYETVAEQKPMTVRQVFYQLVTKGVIEKDQNQYNAVQQQLANMRKAGELPYGWIADNTRWMRKPRSHGGLEELLHQTAKFYRRDLWRNQNAYCEIWLEKEALAGVVSDVTRRWDVPLMVCRGYPSLSFLHSAAMNIIRTDKPTFLYYFGDHDPSGVDIPRKVYETLGEMDAECEFEVVAVNEDQIIEYGLETRPTKESDRRSKNFKGESVELDAIKPDDLRELVSDAITQHIDRDALDQTKRIEAAERETLMEIAGQHDDWEAP